MNKSYQGIFTDVNGNEHTIYIEGDTNEAYPLTLGEKPFVSTMNSDDGTIYKPVKLQAGTIGLVAVDENYYFDIYTGDAQGRPVQVTDANGALEWTGYITPSLYDIGYVTYREELSVDCLDGLSTLQYYRYAPINSAAGIATLLDVVLHCIERCGCYSRVYLADVTRMTSAATSSVWEQCYITERNFVTKTDDRDDNDNLTYLEVLEQVCQWVGVTAVAHGSSVWFVDYDATLPNRTHSYAVYSVSTGTLIEHTTTSTLYTITGSSYAAEGTQLSLDNVYNKVTVTDEANDLDDLLLDFFTDAENVTVADSTILHLFPNCDTGEFIDNTSAGGEKMLAFMDIADGGTSGSDDNKFNAIFVKYYTSPYHLLYRYSSSDGGATWTRVTTVDQSTGFSTLQTLNGAFLARAYVVHFDDISLYKTWALDHTKTFTLDDFMQINDVSSISFTDYIFMTNHTINAYRNNENVGNYPYIQVTADIDLGAFFGGVNSFLLIQGSYIFHDQDGDPYPVPEGEVVVGNPNPTIIQSDAYLLCRLQWGGYYWNGRHWTQTSTTFKLWLEQTAIKQGDAIYHRRSIVNTVSWRDGTSEKGTKIPLPQSGILLSGVPKLTVYQPCDFSAYKTKFIALENFRIKPVVADPTQNADPESDTSYTNVINNGYANTLDEITWKVCTYDGKRPTLNAVAYKNGNDYYYVDTVYNLALSPTESGVTRYNGTTSDGNMRAEEHFIHRLVQQYSQPAKVLNLTLGELLPPYAVVRETNLNADCIVDKVDADYRTQCYTYKVVEKR